MTKKKKVEKNFIDFIIDAQKNPELLEDFLCLREKEEFTAFFATEYEGISREDINKITGMMETFHQGFRSLVESY